ncbi:alpha/beta fold hydrolase [Parvibaculum sp. MBR-TMA-1.3b-4.2]
MESGPGGGVGTAQPIKGNEIAEAVDAVYGFATIPDNWEDLIRLLEHLDGGAAADDAPEETTGAPDNAFRDVVVSHLLRAQELADRLHRSDESAPDAPYAYLLIDRERRIAGCNASGAEVFGEVVASLETGKRLSFASEEHGHNFADALKRAGESAAGPSIMRFLSDEGGVDLLCYLVPPSSVPAAMLRAGGEPLDRDGLLCALAAPERGGAQGGPDVRLALGLTPAEERLAARLKSGLALKEAAADLNISVNTARNQLKSIFEKLGIKRQSDLVRHLVELNMVAAFLDTPSGETPRDAEGGDGRRIFHLPADGSGQARALAYRDLGARDGFPVFVFQSLIVSGLMRPEEIEAARRAGVRLISVDRPGAGLSTPDPDFDYASCARDCRALADHLGLRRAAMFAWASGAPFALAAGAELGERVTGVMLVAPRLVFQPDMERTHPAAEFFGGLRRHPWLIDAVFSIIRSKRSRRFLGPMIKRFFEGSAADAAVIERDPSLVPFFVDGVIEGLDVTREGPVREAQMFAEKKSLDLAGLTAPVTVWFGEDDRMNKPDDVSRMLKNIPVADFRLFPGEGHLIAITRFGEMLEMLKRTAN